MVDRTNLPVGQAAPSERIGPLNCSHGKGRVEPHCPDPSLLFCFILNAMNRENTYFSCKNREKHKIYNCHTYEKNDMLIYKNIMLIFFYI